MKFALVTAAALSVGLLALSPASARPMMAGCSGDGMMKTNAMVDTMADGPQKMMMQKEIGMANDSLSKGDMRGCAMHMNRASQMGMMKQGMGMRSGM